MTLLLAKCPQQSYRLLAILEYVSMNVTIVTVNIVAMEMLILL